MSRLDENADNADNSANSFKNKTILLEESASRKTMDKNECRQQTQDEQLNCKEQIGTDDSSSSVSVSHVYHSAHLHQQVPRSNENFMQQPNSSSTPSATETPQYHHDDSVTTTTMNKTENATTTNTNNSSSTKAPPTSPCNETAVRAAAVAAALTVKVLQEQGQHQHQECQQVISYPSPSFDLCCASNTNLQQATDSTLPPHTSSNNAQVTKFNQALSNNAGSPTTTDLAKPDPDTTPSLLVPPVTTSIHMPNGTSKEVRTSHPTKGSTGDSSIKVCSNNTSPSSTASSTTSNNISKNSTSTSTTNEKGTTTSTTTSKPLRRGKWSVEEEEYAAKVIQDFNSGLLDAPAGTTLRNYLSEKLHCDPMRITKKFTGDACIGKRVFHPAVRCTSNSLIIDKAQSDLIALEQRWKRRLELQQRESSKKSITHQSAITINGASSISSITGGGNSVKSHDQSVTRTACWLDRASAVLLPTDPNTSNSNNINGKDNHVQAMPGVAARTQKDIENQIMEVQRLIHEGPIIQKTTAGLPSLMLHDTAQQEGHAPLPSITALPMGPALESTTNNNIGHGHQRRYQQEQSSPPSSPLDKRPRVSSVGSGTGADEDAEALVGFLNSVRASADASSLGEKQQTG